MFHVPEKARITKAVHKQYGTDESAGNNGLFVFSYIGYEVRVIASDGLGWEHCSVSINRDRTPTWEVMCAVKDLFWDAEDTVIQFHPKKSEYVNCHPYVLHLWRPTEKEIELPDSILVGIKEGGIVN
jgi:hypothetical protein